MVFVPPSTQRDTMISSPDFKAALTDFFHRSMAAERAGNKHLTHHHLAKSLPCTDRLDVDSLFRMSRQQPMRMRVSSRSCFVLIRLADGMQVRGQAKGSQVTV